MTNPLEDVIIDVIKNCSCEEFCENCHSVELYFYIRKLYNLQNNLQQIKEDNFVTLMEKFVIFFKLFLCVLTFAAYLCEFL